MKILITGIHGFVGSSLTRFLMKEHTIYGLDIITPEKRGVKKTYRWSELDDKTLPAVDVIVHLAGKAHDTKNKAGEQVYFDINTGLTKKIYDYFLTASARKFIFFSSVKAVADTVDLILSEDVVPAPDSPYGKSKLLAEQYIQEHGVHEVSAKLVYILRPCMIHGPENKGNLNLLYKMVKKGIPWPLGAYENRRSFASIDNLCYVMEKLIGKNITPGIYNIGDDDAISTNDLIKLICEVLDKKPHIWHLPKSIIKILAWIGGLLHLPLNQQRLSKLTESYVVSNSKIKQALGIQKIPVDVREGLVRTLRSFKD